MSQQRQRGEPGRRRKRERDRRGSSIHPSGSQRCCFPEERPEGNQRGRKWGRNNHHRTRDHHREERLVKGLKKIEYSDMIERKLFFSKVTICRYFNFNFKFQVRRGEAGYWAPWTCLWCLLCLRDSRGISW